MKWNKIEHTISLPPRMDSMTITNDYLVVCKHENPGKRQTAIASYNYETKLWTDSWGSEIENVEYWCESP